MKRRKMLAVIATLILAMGSLSACGKVDLDSMTYEEIADLADDYGIEVTIEPTEDEVIIKDETVVEDKTVIEEKETTKTEPTTNGSTTNSSVTNGSTTNSSATNGSATNSSVTDGSTTNSSTSNGSTNVQPSQSSQPAQPAQPSQPAHTHSWKEHTATKQVWISNIVVVDDYEEQVVGKTPEIATCECGYVTDADSMFEHFKACNVKKGSTYYTTEGGEDIIEQVKVGSHEEDHGYYDIITYVDYYYCDCGETK